MNKTISNQIDELLSNSGLFSLNRFDYKKLQNLNFKNETILITGAAGSIGSEITKQLLSYDFKRIILIDIAESPLYELLKDLEQQKNDTIDFVLINITDEESLEWLFETYKPTIIFHTAAYKHVPLMESNPYEAVKTNIFGTKLLADLSISNNVKKFIFISTDKAVNPISVMGISKHIAERYLLLLNSKQSKTSFLITRFGNIFGSNGSVVPLFLKQIKTGKSLTITDYKISRYFINKHKACSLILQITSFEKTTHSIYTFNMGKPIKIIDLAKKITSLNVYKNKKINIEITELRPGEKLHEDIVSNNEVLITTKHKDILLVTKKEKFKKKKLNFNTLKKINPYMAPSKIKLILLSYI
jgi:FlaA1/EpsC-like NDP-sugar epimerase